MKYFLALALGFTGLMLVAGQYLGTLHPLGGAASAPLAAAAAPSGAAPSVAAVFAPDSLTLERDASGQFHLGTRVNGTETRFLVDTGADTLALTLADAAAAGIDVNPNGFQPIIRTASGTGYGTLVTVERLELGNTELRNVGAVVVKDLEVSLLGQTVLGQLAKVELQGDRMVLTPQ